MGLASFDYLFNNYYVREVYEEIFTLICSIEQDYAVCDGAVHNMTDVIVPQLVELLTSPSYGCSRLLGFCDTPVWKTLDPQDYIDNILADKPDFLKDNDYINKEYEKINEDTEERKTVKVMHITDIHLDFDYKEGTNANCNEPLCCRPINGPAPTPADAAGKYGSALCDLPPITAELMFKYIRDMDATPDLVFWTGDNIAHDIWNQTAYKNADYTIQITNWIKKHWGEIPVFPAPGNHEFYPVNVMRFDGVHPILDQISDVWEDWLDEDSYESFRNYGYYTMPMRGINESWNGFRVIALNTEACNNMNWYLLSQLNDPGDQLVWLEEQLLLAEQNGEKIYMISHVQPGGSDCLYEWSIRYRALVERFQHVILQHLVGHSHKEFFNVFTDSTNSSAINMMHGPGGVTTYTHDNPSFRIYDIDYETGYPVKAYKYYFNITQANEGNPEWAFAFEMTEEYNMTDLSPKSFKDLSERFLTEEGRAKQYVRNKYGQSEYSKSQDCNTDECKRKVYCETTNIIHFEEKDCKGLKRFDFMHDLTDSLFESLLDPWVTKQE